MGKIGQIPWNKGKHMWENKKHPMSGKHFSDKSKKKMSESHRGQIPWSKGKKGIHLSPKSEFKKGQPSPLKGRKNPNGSLAKMGKNNPMYGKRGNLSPFFKNYPVRERVRLMGQSEYIQWRSDIFQRDNWTCQTCGVRGTKLHAHHIKKWSEYKELRYEVKNGVTLCEDCHRLTHKKIANLPSSKV